MPSPRIRSFPLGTWRRGSSPATSTATQSFASCSGEAEMSIDVAVVGTPFLDFTFEGLPKLPVPGEEVVGRALHVAPGGAAMQAIAAARLGLSVAMVGPLGTDVAGTWLREILEREGVQVIAAPGSGTATSA